MKKKSDIISHEFYTYPPISKCDCASKVHNMARSYETVQGVWMQVLFEARNFNPEYILFDVLLKVQTNNCRTGLWNGELLTGYYSLYSYWYSNLTFLSNGILVSDVLALVL